MTYDDIILVPQYSSVESRSECDASYEICGKKFKLPIIPANMKGSIDFKLAEWMSDNGYFYILHRFYDYAEIYNWIESNQNLKNISISIGVKEKDYELINQLVKNNLRVDFITIDIAHGHSVLMRKILDHCFKIKETGTKIIAGNTAHPQAVRDLPLGRCGKIMCDSVKVGISYGSQCITRAKTGFGVPMSTSIYRSFTNKRKETQIIADGSIKTHGDIIKAIILGADGGVMAGSLFAACIDSPAETISVDGNLYKRFYGSASAENKGEKKHVEGVCSLIPCNGKTYVELLNEIEEDLKSACSYGGERELLKMIGKTSLVDKTCLTKLAKSLI